MANFTVKANHYLRQLYSGDRNLVNNSERRKVSTKELGKADTKALSKGISALGSYDYDTEDDKGTDLYNTMRAFADAYNYTLDTGESLSGTDQNTKRLIKEMKKLKEEYGDALEGYGITFDKKGYMSVDPAAMDNMKISTFKNMFGEDSEFLEDLSALQKKLSRRINYLV